MGSCQTAIALFQAKYIIVAAGLLEELDLFADVLEACQDFYEAKTVIPGNSACHVGGNNGSYQCRILRHCVCGSSFS